MYAPSYPVNHVIDTSNIYGNVSPMNFKFISILDFKFAYKTVK